ncbi:MAG: transpeptidase family protein [Spirochaetes bacterium]|nr:transpeptidase family protein [Spirochaetota bacterium]
MNHKVVNRRIYIAGALCLLAALALIVKLSSLHFSHRILLAQTKKSSVKRGAIKDSGGYILATSIEMHSLFANPREITNPDETAGRLSPLLGIGKEQLARSLSRKGRGFVWIRRKLDSARADEIRRMNLKGLYFRREYKRVYPHDSLAANAIGFVGADNEGLEGIEYKYNGLLSGADTDPEGGGALEGATITLTIDRYIQHLAEQAIAETVRRHRANQGTVVVLQVKTGRILAMARYPTFNPNLYFQFTPFDWRNFAVIDTFEPGSTIKIFALAALLESVPGILGQYFQCNGHIDIADRTINCTHTHGRVGIRDIIRHSCNVGIIQAMRQVRNARYRELLSRFGFGRVTDAGLPGEAEGILRPTSQWSAVSKYSLSIGHEMSATAIQMAAAFGAIANRGVYMIPSIVESVTSAEGAVLHRFQPRSRGRVIRRDFSLVLMDMMRAVVLSGTGVQAASLIFAVVGKTGTSRKADMRGGGYTDRVIASFVGIAPYEDPEVCIMVVVDDPADRQSGGEIAAPVVGRIVDRVLTRLGVTGRRYRAALPARTRRLESRVSSGRMPDMRGMSVAQALAALSEITRTRPIPFDLSGSGSVYSQDPAPGASLAGAERISIRFSEE